MRVLKKADLNVRSYEAVAGEYYDPARHPTCRNFREASAVLLRAFLADRYLPDTLICDIGAGDSLVAEILRCRGHTLTNTYIVDNSLGMISYSRRYSREGAKLIVGEAERLPFAPSTFAFVVASLGDPYNTPAFWEEVHYALRDDGWCLFTTPSFDWASRYRRGSSLEREDLALFELRNGTDVYLSSLIYPIPHQCAMIKSHGLEVERIEHVPVSKLASPLSPKLVTTDSGNPIYPVTGFLIRKQAS